MATISTTFFMKDKEDDREDDGPTAVRDFPAGCISMPRRLLEDTNHPAEVTKRDVTKWDVTERDVTERDVTKREVTKQEGKLSDNFYKLSPREQFFERCGLFNWLFRYYLLCVSPRVRRPDLKAMKQINIDSSSFKFEGLGPVPGVEVGDTFDYRAEMYVVGLHQMEEAGIACVNLGNEMIACSVVFSGGYKDDVDHGNVIYYSGHGGNDEQRTGRKEDQKLNAGNRGLLNSLKQKTPVRVIRGRKHGRTVQEIEGLSGKITPYKKYSYDGLYIVTEHKFVVGVEGHKIHIFKLVRQLGQPMLDMNRVG